MSRPSSASPFAGFWMGGFEGADHVNAHGMPLDMARASGHLDQLEADHRRAAEAGFTCVRESIGWRLSEAPGGAIDLGRAQRIARSAQRHGLQVLWTLMHYGVPADLCLHEDRLIPRFERFASAVAHALGEMSETAPVYTPINEIGYLAWIASQPGQLLPPNGLADGDAESSRISGYGVKRRLARAALAAVHEMRRVDPRARFMHVEPLVHVVAPDGVVDAAQQAEWRALAEEVASWQWHAWDLLAGLLEPGLGGSAEALDTVGVNHYHSSQWELTTERRLAWHLRDARRRPMADLLEAAWRRYGRPLVMAETSHVGIGRAAWLHEMADQARCALRRGVPLQGLCLYPLVDRPDWNDPAHWHRSGLWHVAVAEGPDVGALPRVPEHDGAAALAAWQRDATGFDGGPIAVLPRLVVWSRCAWRGSPRLQALATRLAGRWSVVFVEPPVHEPGVPSPDWRVDRQVFGPWLDVLTPRHAGIADGPDAASWCVPPRLQESLHAALTTRLAEGDPPIAWLDDPHALPLARATAPSAWVWEAPGAPPADIACRRVRLDRSTCGVDLAQHAACRQDPMGWAEEEVRQLLRPFGTPRLVCLAAAAASDLGLLRAVARARPQWTVLVPGDAARDDALPNLHPVELPPLALIPAWLAACEVGLLPLAGPGVGPTHEAQAEAGPAGWIDGLAAGLPLVATRFEASAAAVLCGPGCRHADTLDGFVRACEAALAEPPAAAAARRAAARASLAPFDWDALADAAHRQLAAAR